MPSKKPKAAPDRERLSEKTTNKAINNTTTKVQPGADDRSNPGQTMLPIVPAIAYPPAPGLKRGLLVVEHCPHCGWWHRHQTRWPVAAPVAKRARCGYRYDLIPYVRRTKKRATR